VRAIKIDPNPAVPIEIIAVESGYQNLAAAIGGGCRYIERFACPLTPTYGLVGVCDEEGQYSSKQRENQRAWPLYPVPNYALKGAVLVMGEGLTPGGIDFIDLPNPDLAMSLVATLLERTHHA